MRMRAAAKLDRIGPLVVVAVVDLAHADDAHLVAIFLAEQSAGAGRARIVEAHEPRRHLGVLQDDVIGDVLDLFEFGPRDRLRVSDVEAQPLGRNQRALLRHMIAKHDAQSLMQDVGRRMVGARRRARVVIDLKLDREPHARRAFDDRHVMDDEVAELLARVGRLRRGSRTR